MADNKEVLKSVYTGLTPLLKQAGFKLKGRNFLRECEPGVYQLIDFGLGNTFSSMANHVSVSFAVTTEEWIQHFMDWKRPTTLTASDYEIVNRFWLTETTTNNSWHSVEQDTEVLLQNISAYLQHTVLPFLDRMKTRPDIIKTWKAYRNHHNPTNLRDTMLVTLLQLQSTNAAEKEEAIATLHSIITSDKSEVYFIEKAEQLLKDYNATSN